ncbi:hypothetical protein LAZ67_2001146 [Cordylochernes scorpioides]|uniref:Mos1 transposase HTH domain-containing protein n=1 Tax=Cordylochernes scorpioides TaxID=51811 RepID=A0ABY6K0Z6_9ARAC|nr:hypothetical protein LAZ67_2001146 [Cordylochernes scorpioides]
MTKTKDDTSKSRTSRKTWKPSSDVPKPCDKFHTFDLTSSRQCSKRQAAIIFTEATSFYKLYMERFPRQQDDHQRPSLLTELSSHNCVLDRLRFLPIKKNGSKNLCIKFCVKNEIKCADAFRMLTVAYGEATLDRSNVYRWYKMFSESREDVNDEESAGTPEHFNNRRKN